MTCADIKVLLMRVMVSSDPKDELCASNNELDTIIQEKLPKAVRPHKIERSF